MIPKMVVITEMINTAVEKTVDMVTQEYNPLAKIAKDVAAGIKPSKIPGAPSASDARRSLYFVLNS